jgi:hypothetical protein
MWRKPKASFFPPPLTERLVCCLSFFWLQIIKILSVAFGHLIFSCIGASQLSSCAFAPRSLCFRMRQRVVLFYAIHSSSSFLLEPTTIKLMLRTEKKCAHW